MQLQLLMYVLLGFISGGFSGLVGVGGGIILVPALVFLFGQDQHQAQGTTLALMVPPIGLFAAYEYYKQGYVDLRVAGLICLGFIIGGFFGAKLAVAVPTKVLSKIFGSVMLIAALKMLFTK